ncbi:MAG: M1 family metallopeptidase [Erythrobacter sp.]|nr:MAG: M1 family metallopeptidase [Erythrobacter sp.]
MTPKIALFAMAAGACALAAPVSAQHAVEAVPALPYSGPLHERTAQSDLPLEGPRAAMRIEHVEMVMQVLPETRYLASHNRYQVLLTGDLDQLQFDLDPRYDVVQVFVDREDLPQDRFRNRDGLLTIDLPSARQTGEMVEVDIIYGGHPHVAANPPWDGGFVWAQTPAGEPWIATAVQGEGCDMFWPCIDHSSSRIGSIDMEVTVPDGLVAAGNGVLVETVANTDGTTTYHWSARNPSNYGITLQIGPYQLAEQDYQSRFGNVVPIRFWHLPGSKAQARRLVAEMATYLDFFEERIGPYPFGDEKAGVAETPHLGMEHQTINAYGNGYRPDPLGYDWLLQHEFAHEWFANQLTNASINHMWLHEGIGQWMQPLYLEWARGEMLYDAEMWRFRQEIRNNVPLVSPEGQLPDYNDQAEGWGFDIYYKGAWVMHSLRYLVGDEVLFPALTRLTYGTDTPVPGQIAPVLRSTDDFRVILEDATGDDLNWFFDTYFYQAELPRLEQSREGNVLTLEWQTTAERAFEMPVEVSIAGQVRRVEMPGGRAQITLPDMRAQVLVDPRNQILMHDEAIERARGSR